ncbi:putative Septin-2A [Glarea lozoyensis 74030]|uniref:Putative Septin-2A n=1 Tax=Glarea lozoyensis (strain ATCC 74030 / MF5533) TaxID=1104152 RepID=H0EVK4_GLAL7|nr:putative Septin-2A [Glarea lozoyensis 74030]
MVSASQRPSAGASPSPPPNAKLPEIDRAHPPRRTSLGQLLRRTKSSELKGSKKQQALAAREAEARKEREAAAIPKSPPRLPDLYGGAPPQVIESFGGEDRPDSVAIISGRVGQGRASMDQGRSSAATGSVPIPPIPNSGSRNGDWVDPYASSAVSTINSPRRVRRRKDPTPFNILIIGAKSSGKTSFLNFLKTSLALPVKKRSARAPEPLNDDIFAPPGQKSGNFDSHYLETEIDGERIGLTLWDSEGLEKNVVDLQLREMSSFLESKFEETFTEEMKVVRAPVGGLDEDLDLQVLRTLQGKTTVVPVISKADTITTAHMSFLKKTVSDSLKRANIDPLEALGLDDFEESRTENRIDEADEPDSEDEIDDLPIQTPEASSTPNSKRFSSGSVRRHKRNESDPEETPYLPLSIISPDMYEPGIIGRRFPWGFADPMNAEHCDFVRLKEAVFSEWRGELREASRELWYEGWRTSRLKHREGKPVPRR